MNNIIKFENYNLEKGAIMETKVEILEKKLFSNSSKLYTIEQTEQLARDVLCACEFNDIIGATPIIKIANYFGFSCLKANNMPDNISGNIFVGGTTKSIYNTDKVIIVGSDEEYAHQRFIIAHELGHYLIDYIGSPESENPSLLFTKTYPKVNHCSEKEIRADRFAAELLMPSKLFTKQYIKAAEASDFNKKYIVSYLSTFFKTKKSSIERRINEVTL